MRKKPVSAVQSAVLTKSARRCALCFHLSGTLKVKMGQIAHVDKNRLNDAEDNLVFLCMDHHTLYDSTTSQHKNFTRQEVKAARTSLYTAIANRQHHVAESSHADRSSDSDRRRLTALIQLMSGKGSIEFLRKRSFAGWSFEWSRLEGIEIVLARQGPEHEFLNKDLERLRRSFLTACQHIITTLATNTSPVGLKRDRQAVPAELETEKPVLFKQRVDEINSACDALCDTYDCLIRTARRTLGV
ncbi:MAG: hypothetical protein OXL36_04465 [Bryobacterales bacterium]|nr:hypothetical protein [Bryobacterales bacterium]MDE0292778.1 hypothetical protein [Bryobacterales bacterium]